MNFVTNISPRTLMRTNFHHKLFTAIVVWFMSGPITANNVILPQSHGCLSVLCVILSTGQVTFTNTLAA